MDNLSNHAKHILDFISICLACIGVALHGVMLNLPYVSAGLSAAWMIVRFIEWGNEKWVKWKGVK